ncbi:AGE family epimerase/isomerase [Cohnella mopanensis]|uniref:AGE family epimerase/isomerase n=1 Tax=Cohnella mopanensis TaxID=2911966 RepID=UPI001EF83092|nr:AGE family epimerase/isomerase [Cohnella mopanensis]
MQLGQLEQWKDEIGQELEENILNFWIRHTQDKLHGGFIGEISSDMTMKPEADKGLVLNARILWTFACAYRHAPDERYLEMARRAYDELWNQFRDQEHGGLHWMVDVDGTPTQPKKQVYGQAFTIYALAEFYRALPDPEVLRWAVELYELLEKHAYDNVHLGYFEAMASDWSPTREMSLSGKDMNEPKSMNTHLHVLEAYTNLYRIWKPEGLRGKLAGLIDIHLDKIVDGGNHHFKLFFSEDWVSQTSHISYGHDIEGSWLLLEAAEVLGDDIRTERVKAEAIEMARVTLAEGTDFDGAILNESDGQGHLDDTKDWWPQAEAVVGYLNAYQLTGEQTFLEAAKNSWAFIQSYIRDDENGEWHWGVTRDGQPIAGEPKVSAWKCPYHNSRACFEAMERIKHILTTEGNR